MSPGPRRIPDVLLEQGTTWLPSSRETHEPGVEALLAESETDRARLEELRAHSEAFLRTHPALEGALRTRLEAALVQSQEDRAQRVPRRAWSEPTLETKERQRGSWWEVLTSVALAGGLATFLTWVSNPEVDPAPGTHSLPSQAAAPSAAAPLESEAPPEYEPPEGGEEPSAGSSTGSPTPPTTKPSKPRGLVLPSHPLSSPRPWVRAPSCSACGPTLPSSSAAGTWGKHHSDPIETSAGKYTVQFINDDLKKKVTQTFELKPGETKVIRINLEE